MASGILRPKNSKINTRQRLKRERERYREREWTCNAYGKLLCTHFRMESIEKHITILHKIKVFSAALHKKREREGECGGDREAIESYKARMSFWSTVCLLCAALLFFCLSIVARLFVARRARNSNKLLQKQSERMNQQQQKERESERETIKLLAQWPKFMQQQQL